MTAQLPSKARLEDILEYGSARIISPITDDEIKALTSFALAAHEQEPVVNDAMALAFHHSLTDGTASRDDLDEIKTGLRAALANYTHPAPVPAVPDEMTYDAARNFVLINGMANEDRATLAMRVWNSCRAAMLNGGKS